MELLGRKFLLHRLSIIKCLVHIFIHLFQGLIMIHLHFYELHNQLEARRTSWKTIFDAFPCWSLIKANLRWLGEPTLEHATYSCPWVNTWPLNQTPANFRVCPCDLLIVMAKAGLTGNCQRCHSKEYSPGLLFLDLGLNGLIRQFGIAGACCLDTCQISVEFHCIILA